MKTKLFLILTAITLTFQACSSSDDDNNNNEPVIATCETPINLSISEITFNSAILNWESPNTNQDVKVEYGLAGFTLGTGAVLMTSLSSISINGLTPDTSYSFYVQALCSTDNSSTVSDVFTFNTSMAPSPYAGIWSGTYAGDDTGTWILVISESGTFVSGSLYSNNANVTDAIISATVSDDGHITTITENGGTTDGQFTGENYMGTWDNPNFGISGTLIGSRE